MRLENLLAEQRTCCIVPSRNGIDTLPLLLESLASQSLKVDVFFIDSSSTDGTLELIQKSGSTVHVIPKEEFNHGATRQLMVERLSDHYDFLVFLTQDAYPADSFAIENIILPFQDKNVGAVCGRQIPHKDANVYATHARTFNYPSTSSTRNKNDIGRYGVKTIFLSNSFAAYRVSALRAVGGFPSNVILGEDMFVAAKMIDSGWNIAYEASAKCHHSHNYSMVDEFKRYFDTGVFHARERATLQRFDTVSGEGRRFIISEFKYIGYRHPIYLVGSIIRNAVKLIGYKIGRQEQHLPLSLKRALSMHRGYWVTQ